MRADTQEARLYRAFQVLNADLKLLCTRWQLRDPQAVPMVINDHSDPVYDAAIIDELGRLHERTRDLLLEGASVFPGVCAYGGRLHAALAALAAGDTTKFTAPGADSYHDAWMELHEFLLASLGLGREEEDA